MGLVNFAANLRPVSRIGIGAKAVEAPTKLSIRLVAIPKERPSEIKAESQWAWAIVQETEGQPDRFLFGGQTESMSTAAAQAHLELQRYEAQLALKKGK